MRWPGRGSDPADEGEPDGAMVIFVPRGAAAAPGPPSAGPPPPFSKSLTAAYSDPPKRARARTSSASKSASASAWPSSPTLNRIASSEVPA